MNAAVAALVGRAVVRVAPLGGAYRVWLAGGGDVVAKRHSHVGAVRAEVAGLRWLRAPAGPRTPPAGGPPETNLHESPFGAPGGPPVSTLPGSTDKNGARGRADGESDETNPSESPTGALAGRPDLRNEPSGTATLADGTDRTKTSARAGGEPDKTNPSESPTGALAGRPDLRNEPSGTATLADGTDRTKTRGRAGGESTETNPSESPIGGPGGPPVSTLPEGTDSFGVRDGGYPQVPAVVGFDDEWLVVEAVPVGRATPAAAERFGRELAALHQAGARAFGEPPPGGPVEAWIGLAPMRNVTGPRWPEWYAEHRVLPYLRTAVDQGVLHDPRPIEAICDRIGELAGPPEPPARLHGDLWSGNVLWADDAWLIDPAAHGGHRETDLAMLRLFGCPHLDRIIAAYDEAAPLADGWRARIGLHQLFPLLVHTVLFGGGYGAQAVAAARSLA